MENPDQVAQKPVGSERNFVIIRYITGVAAVDLVVVEGGELSVEVVFGGKSGVSVVGGTVVLKQPEISIMRAFKHSLEGQRHCA